MNRASSPPFVLSLLKDVLAKRRARGTHFDELSANGSDFMHDALGAA